MMHTTKQPPIFAYGSKDEMEREQLSRIPIEPYVSEDFYRKELRTIWRKCWLWAGRWPIWWMSLPSISCRTGRTTLSPRMRQAPIWRTSGSMLARHFRTRPS